MGKTRPLSTRQSKNSRTANVAPPQQQNASIHLSPSDVAESIQQHLLSLDNLNDNQVAVLNKVNELLDAGNPTDLYNYVMEYSQNFDVQAHIATEDGKVGMEDLIADDPELATASEAAKQNILALRKALVHNPEDTIAEAQRQMEQFPSVELQIFNTAEDLPSYIKNQAKREGVSLDSIRAFSRNNAVAIVADKVRPSDVAKTIGHEVIGHKGLRSVMGDSFDALLDSVYSQHMDEVAELGNKYNRNTETIANQRYLTEEFLSNMANSEVKPNWWKEFLQKVKTALRKVPGLTNLRYTDSEVEALLMRSARAMRSMRSTTDTLGTGEAINGTARFKVNENGETILGVDGRPGEWTVEQIVNDSSISPHTFILTSEGLENWGQITPEMIANADPKLGLEAIPIRLLKGIHRSNHTGYGLLHIDAQHMQDLVGKDLSDYLQSIFATPSVIYASKHGSNIRLELVRSGKPQNIGIIELRKNDGYYSIVTAFPRRISHYKLAGKEIWRSTVPDGSYSKQRAVTLKPLIAGEVAGDARRSTAKPIDNIANNDNLSRGDGENNANILRQSDIEQTETSEFKKWFGDSKVVDENGKPLVVYHITPSTFTKFKAGGGLSGKGIYMTTDLIDTSYSNDPSWNVMELYASIKNPVEVDALVPKEKIVEWQNKLIEEYRQNPPKNGMTPEEMINNNLFWGKNPEKIKWLELYKILDFAYKGLGKKYAPDHDGVKITRPGGVYWYVAWKPTQIKSATDNIGTFDGRNPDIRFSLEDITPEPTKAGYKVVDFNKNLATEFTRLPGVVAEKNAIFDPAELPEHGKIKWIKEQALAKAVERGIIGEHNTPPLNDLVAVLKKGISNTLNHGGNPIRQNLVAVIPQMLENSVLVQSENNGRSISHILLSKVRYDGKRYAVGLVIHETNGKLFYDHELIEINAIDSGSGEIHLRAPSNEGNQSRSVMNIIKKYLLSSDFDKNNPDNARFELNSHSEQEAKELVTFLRPYVGRVMDKSAAEYLKIFQDAGLPVDTEREAHSFAVEAMRQNKAENLQRNRLAKEAWLHEQYPLYSHAVDIAGTGFYIKPSYRYKGDDFSGSFISPEWVRNSDKKSKKEGLKAVEENTRIDEKLKNGQGFASDEMAKIIADRTGGDALQIEDALIEFFRYLKKSDLNKAYSDWRKENSFLGKLFSRSGFDLTAAFALLTTDFRTLISTLLHTAELRGATARQKLRTIKFDTVECAKRQSRKRDNQSQYQSYRTAL